MGGLTGQKITHGLGWGHGVAAAAGPGGLFPPLLEPDTGQRVVPREIFRAYAHQETAIDVFLVPGPQGHPVGDHLTVLAGGGHHLPAWADAEGEGGAAIGR